MRIFLAIKISSKLQETIERWELGWRNLPVRWLRGENLHITLLPPWAEKEDGLEEIKSRLKVLENEIGPVEMLFENVSFGPNQFNPRLIWAEGCAPPAVVNFKNKLAQILQRHDDDRLFLLHLTLARFRPENFSSFPVKKIEEKVSWPETATSFVLMESRLLPSGAEYKVLEKFAL